MMMIRKRSLLLMAVVAVVHLIDGAMSGSCRPVTGSPQLLFSGGNPCTVGRINTSSVIVTSPQGTYRDCSVRFWTRGPSYLDVQPQSLSIDPQETLHIKTALAFTMHLEAKDVGETIFAPTAHSSVYYKHRKGVNNSTFSLLFTAKKTNCHQVCSLEGEDAGTISHLPYARNTYCQWWITAPRGCKIALEFNEFNLGTEPDSEEECHSDYVAIAMRGEPAYSYANSATLCGHLMPTEGVSDSNKLNVLLDGYDGNYNGFRSNYSVICP